MAEIAQGQDENIEFVIDKDGVPVDLDSVYTQIVVVFIYCNNNVTLVQYARDPEDGFNNDDFEVTNSAAGEFTIHMQSALTAAANTGEINYEIKVRETNAKFTDGFKPVKKGNNVFTIVEAKTKNDNLIG